MIVLRIAGHRKEQEIAGTLGQIVVSDFIWRMIGARRDCRHAGLGPRFVIGRVAHDIHAVPARRDQLDQGAKPAHQRRRRPVFDNRPTRFRVA